MGNCQYEGRPLAPPWNHIFPSLSCDTPHCAPFAPTGSLSTPLGVQRARNPFTVLYIQLSRPTVKKLSSCSTFASRPKPVSKSSRLSATPSLFVSVYFQISWACDSLVRIVFGPNGSTNRGNTSLSTNTLCFS